MVSVFGGPNHFGAGARTKNLRRLPGAVPGFRLLQPAKNKMHLLRETFFLTLAMFLKTFSKYKPLLISDSMNTIVKLFSLSRWIDDLK